MGRYMKVVLTVIAVCLAWICLRDIAPWHKSVAAEGEGPKVIQAQAIELSDGDGHKHIRLSALEGWPSLEFFDPDKMLRVRLSLDETRVMLQLLGREKGDSMVMHLTKNGGPSLMMHDNDSGTAEVLVEEKGSALIRLVDKDGKTVWRQPPGREIFRSDPQK